MQIGISTFFNPWLGRQSMSPVHGGRGSAGAVRRVAAHDTAVPGTDSRPQASAIYHRSSAISGTQAEAPAGYVVGPSRSSDVSSTQRGLADDGSQKAANDEQGVRGRKSSTSATGQTLSREQQAVLDQLQSRDRQVHQHEAAHQAVGGRYAGSASFSYKRGPDGALYAVGGEVSVDASPVDGDPKATIRKMQTVRAAALAPAQPSGQDLSVAAQATQALIAAQAELAKVGPQQSADTQQAGNSADKSDKSGNSEKGDKGDTSKPASKAQADGAAAYANVARMGMQMPAANDLPQRAFAQI